MFLWSGINISSKKIYLKLTAFDSNISLSTLFNLLYKTIENILGKVFSDFEKWTKKMSKN